MVRERLKLSVPKNNFDPALANDEVERQYQLRSEDDPLLFALGLIIPSAKGPQLLSQCVAPFQLEAFETLKPSLIAVRNGTMPPRRRYWIERTKKASKDADIAICLLWLMAFAKRPILCQVSAANRQQAGIIKRRAKAILYYNPWLNDRIKIQQNRIIGHKSLGEVVIEATGSSGAKQGDTPDVLVLNELVHVEKWGVNETHMNNADGVPQGIVIISTNAGIKGTKAEVWRKVALQDTARWTTHIFSGVAPWIDPKDVEESKRRDPIGIEHARLWGGLWVSGRGGAIDEGSLGACFKLSGPTMEPEPGWQYVAGLDLGVSHDHSGIVLLGANYKEQRIKVAWLKGFVPSVPNDRKVLEVDSDAVEQACFELSSLFKIVWFGYDPAAGGSFMAQRLRKRGVLMKEMPFSKTNKKLMAEAFIHAVKDGKLECYEDNEGRLRRDFGKFEITAQIPSGYVLNAVSDEWGHADVGTALVICLPKAVQLIGISLAFQSDDILSEDVDDFTTEEKEDTPEELRDIMELYDSKSLPKRPRMGHMRPCISDW